MPDEPGGFRLCREEPPPEATGCTGSFDECCTSAECTERPGGGCYLGVFCGGAWRDQNVCRYDDCTTSAQCTASPHGVCVPRGVPAREAHPGVAERPGGERPRRVPVPRDYVLRDLRDHDRRIARQAGQRGPERVRTLPGV